MRKKGVLRNVLLAMTVGLFLGCVGCKQKEEVQNGTKVTQEAQQQEDGSENEQSENAIPPENDLQPEESKEPEQQPQKGEMQAQETAVTTQAVCGEVPLLFVETENQAEITGDEVYTNCKITVTNCDAEYELIDMAAGIRIRGNSTKMNEKRPYRIKFEEKQQVLGLSEGAHKSWVLLAEFNDPTLLRNLITYRFANELSGISYATDCALVEVYLNGEYEGIYLLAEQTQVDEDRIALDETGVTDGSVVDTGYLLELEADLSRRNEEGKEGEAWFTVTGYADEKDNSMQMLIERTFDESAAYYVVKSDARSAEQMAYIRDYMIKVYDAVYQEKTKAAVEELVDLASAVDMYLVQLIANDYDNNYSSMYLYKDAGGKLMFGAPWDYDLAYGNFNGHAAAEDTVYVYHLLRRLGEYDWFREMAADRFTELSEGEDSLIAQMRETISALTEEYAEEFEREYTRWRKDLVSMNGAGNFGGFGGGWGNFEMPEGTEGFGGFDGWENFEMPEGAEGFGGFGGWENFEMPEGAEGFGGFGGWGNFEMPEGAEGFGGFGGWENFEMPEGAEGFGGFGSWGNFEMPEGVGGFGGFGGMNKISFGAVYDTHEEATEALLTWLDARLEWIGKFLRESETE